MTGRGFFMKKKLSALVLACLMMLSTVLTMALNVTTVTADDTLTLRVHYHREDGKYDGWDAWLWPTGGSGDGYEFVEENGEMVATYEVPGGTTEVGYIIRTQDWTKDVDKDQFINVAECLSGTIDMYIESGVEGCELQYGEDVVTGTRLLSASYSDGKITAKVAGEVEDKDTAFTVKGAEGIIPIDFVIVTMGDYVIKLGQELTVGQEYTITYNGEEYKVSMPDYYGTEEFESQYTYTGDDLGATWTKDATSFRLWAPTATAVNVKLYQSGTPDTDDLIESVPMTQDVNGTWVATKEGDLNKVYYTYEVTVEDETVEACDPYARTTGVNGKRAMILDLESTNPDGWDKDATPNAGLTINDAVIYELHIRDLGMDESSGIENKGKYLSLTEHGTKTKSGIATGIDHIKELGANYVHLQPIYDFGSVDETKCENFNWGYDPVNYNVPEGSYSSDPYNGEVRVKELKQMVQSLHEDEIGVVMDVVYNHVQSADEFCFNVIVPNYFSRVDQMGNYSSGSGCGNDTASERAMVKKYIVDSVCYWAKEYHIDGFRFDLVGLIDTETLNEVISEVHKINPDIILYGEGWSLDTQLTKEGYTLSTQKNAAETPGFAYFSDNIRDSIRGTIFDTTANGYVSGVKGLEESMQQCFLGQDGGWAQSPSEVVHYASCHDNDTLFDRLHMSNPKDSEEDIIKENKLSAAIVFTSEGVPFILAGEEMLRTKQDAEGNYDTNSFSSSDEVNSLKWDSLDDKAYMDTFEYYKGLIAFRKAHPVLRLNTAKQVEDSVKVVTGLDKNVTAYEMKGEKDGVKETVYAIFNPNKKETTVTLPKGKWNVYIDGEKAGTEVIKTVSGKVKVPAISSCVLVQSDAENYAANTKVIVIVVVVVVAVAAGCAGFVFARKRKKK